MDFLRIIKGGRNWWKDVNKMIDARDSLDKPANQTEKMMKTLDR